MNNPLDLDAIKARAENAATASGRSGMEYIVDCVKSAADVPALVAEVERLRAERADIWDAGFDAAPRAALMDANREFAMRENPYRGGSQTEGADQ